MLGFNSIEINVIVCYFNCLKCDSSILKLKSGYMLQYGCHFVTDWHAHPRSGNTAWNGEGCGYWLSAEERRERFVHCKSHRLLYWLKHVEASLVWLRATGHLHLQILNWSLLFPGHHNNMSCCTLILQGRIHSGCRPSGKATLFWNNMGGTNATFI